MQMCLRNHWLTHAHTCVILLSSAIPEHRQESQRAYGTADIMTETCDLAKNLKSLPFIGTILYLN